MATKNDLEGLMGDWEPTRDAYQSTLRRARSREVRRRLAAGIIALGIFMVPVVLLLRGGDPAPTNIAGADAASPFILTYPGHNSDFARTEGTITIADGCVMLQRSPSDVMLVAWPSGTSVEVDSGGTVSLVTVGGGVATVGEHIAVSGGSISRSDASEAYDQVVQAAPDACLTSEIWEIGDILPAAAS